MIDETLKVRADKAFAEHTLEILRDVGLYRHLRCQKPGTWTYGFDVVTWPGYLCVCGDIGTWVFSRVSDMLPWFEASSEINPDYWSQKLADGHDRARRTRWEYSEEQHGAEGRDDWDAQFIFACYGIVLAIRLYREATS